MVVQGMIAGGWFKKARARAVRRRGIVSQEHTAGGMRGLKFIMCE